MDNIEDYYNIFMLDWDNLSIIYVSDKELKVVNLGNSHYHPSFSKYIIVFAFLNFLSSV